MPRKPREVEPTKNDRMLRYVMVCFLWTAWLFVTLSCVSYHSSDTMFVANPSMYFPGGAPPVHNWCGKVGATVAYITLGNVGPGLFIGIIMLAIALVVWTRGDDVTQFSLRMIGGALLVCVISTMFNLTFTERTLPAGPGGTLGVAIGAFLRGHFAGAGSWLIVLLTLVVALLLAVDELMLALPHHIATQWNKVPTDKVAETATSAAGGMWSGIMAFVGTLGSKPMGKQTKSDMRKLRPAAKDVVKEAAKDAAAKESTASTTAVAESNNNDVPVNKPVMMKAESPAVVAADEAGDDEDKSPPMGEPIIRKPLAAAALLLNRKPVNIPIQKQDLGNYRMPGLDLLDEAEPVNTDGQEKRVREKAKALEAALESFNINGKVEAIDTGPVVTLYELALAPGVKSAQVAALSKDIARALMSPPVRIIDNIPGKSTMGVEVPNLDRERVRLKELMQLGGDRIERMELPMCLGKDASGNPLIEDLARIPHLLIAGTTGSGKSVCINSIIMTLCLTQRPDHVKMIMVDPKMVEMQDYKSIPHLMAPIIDDMTKAESILEWATQKMDERYETLSEAGVRHIKDYNKLTRADIIDRFKPSNEEEEGKLSFHLPYIVIIIDELADLMMTSKEVEGHIVRIAQKARAVGIHLILATQRPEAQVVTGLIKSNMPGRLCFQVRSRLDSRIMLDQPGGELLLGQGDMLMLKPTGGGLVRGQGAFVDDNEIKKVCAFLREIAQPEFHPELLQLGQPAGLSEAEKDPVFDQAVDIMIETGRGSVSLLQRRLTIGYSRASRLIEQMRSAGIVGAYKGSMASEVLVTKDEWEALKAEQAKAREAEAALAEDAGNVGRETGSGRSAGYAAQVSSTFDADSDDDDVPDEMPGEHRM
jgi:S-DNA-T family DNA segregation ATPase FtsK/SpoIIIE